MSFFRTPTTKNHTSFVESLIQKGLISRTVDTFAPDPDMIDDPTTSPASPTHGVQIETNALLHQVIHRLVGMSRRTIKTITTTLTSMNNNDTDEDEEVQNTLSEQRASITTTTPVKHPPSPTFDGLAAPTPNTAMRAIKSSTFLRVSSLNPLTKAYAIRSPGEVPSIVSDFFRNSSSINIK